MTHDSWLRFVLYSELIEKKELIMTSRAVEVVSINNYGQGWEDDINEHGESVINMAPDHRVYRIIGVNCTTVEFADWFSLVDTDNELVFAGGRCDEIIDLGGAGIELRVGMQLEITFEQYFNAWLERRIAVANNQLDTLVIDDPVNNSV